MRECVRDGILVRGESVGVGLSGGPDSLALTAAMVAEGLTVTAICVDHGLQEGSRAVSEQAAETARLWGAEAVVVPVDVPAGNSLEAAARAARYQAFSRWAASGDQLSSVAPGNCVSFLSCGGRSGSVSSGDRSSETRTVAVAHTMDDLAESFVLAGLRGNPAAMAREAVIEGCRIVRPLLGVRRADTVGACEEIGVTPWNDPQNADPEFRRVRVRREVLPLLGDIVGGDAVPALARAAGRMQVEATRMESTTVPLATKDLPQATRHDIIAGALRAAGAKVSTAHVEGVDKLLTQWHGQGPRDVGGGLVALRVSGEIKIEEKIHD